MTNERKLRYLLAVREKPFRTTYILYHLIYRGLASYGWVTQTDKGYLLTEKGCIEALRLLTLSKAN